MAVTDKQGVRYYDIDEAMSVLGVKRSTLQRLVAKLAKYRKERDRKIYYRVEDVEALRDQPIEMRQIVEPAA